MVGTPTRRAMVARAAAFAAAGALSRPFPARSADWPTQPLRLVVPFAPGGTTDIVARIAAQGLGARLGQPVIVENKPGAGATVGSQMVAQAAPDGTALLLSNIASHGISPTLYRDPRYDPLRDFAHIGLLAESPSVWVANPRFAARSLADVIAMAKADRAGLDIASSGSGSSNHLLIVEFARLTGAALNHVPYRGAGPAMTDVIAGVVPMMSDSLPSSSGHLRQGAVRAIAMSSAERHPAFPDVPTFREQGIALVSTSWFGISAPAATPRPIVQRLAETLQAVLGEPDVAARLISLGATPGQLGPEDYTNFIKSEIARWAPVIRLSGAQVD